MVDTSISVYNYSAMLILMRRFSRQFLFFLNFALCIDDDDEKSRDERRVISYMLSLFAHGSLVTYLTSKQASNSLSSLSTLAGVVTPLNVQSFGYPLRVFFPPHTNNLPWQETKKIKNAIPEKSCSSIVGLSPSS